MDRRIADAYWEYSQELVRADILDHALDNKILDGMTVDQAIVDILREAGRLPEGYEEQGQ